MNATGESGGAKTNSEARFQRDETEGKERDKVHRAIKTRRVSSSLRLVRLSFLFSLSQRAVCCGACADPTMDFAPVGKENVSLPASLVVDDLGEADHAMIGVFKKPTPTNGASKIPQMKTPSTSRFLSVTNANAANGGGAASSSSMPLGIGGSASSAALNNNNPVSRMQTVRARAATLPNASASSSAGTLRRIKAWLVPLLLLLHHFGNADQTRFF
jgi:hypothetical protein